MILLTAGASPWTQGYTTLLSTPEGSDKCHRIKISAPTSNGSGRIGYFRF